jgi:ketosteroid isomerase-like protein
MNEEVIPILRVADAAASAGWYGRLGFTRRWEHRFAPGLPAFVEVARGDVRLFLSEHDGDARPDTLVYLRVRDIDAIAAEFGTTVRDAPWARETELRDPDGNRLRLGQYPEPTAAETVRALWDRMEARDWAGIGELLAEDAVVEWPVSGERIVGRANYLAVNAEYPEGWSIRVLRIVADGDTVVSEVEVPHRTMGVHRVTSLWTVRDGRIVAGREYWTRPAADPAPGWRARWVEPLPE